MDAKFNLSLADLFGFLPYLTAENLSYLGELPTGPYHPLRNIKGLDSLSPYPVGARM